jgi:ABC-type Fe3+ transport system substrate-binding protein
VKGSINYDLATKYVNFWLSQEGQKWLAKYGFGSTLPGATTRKHLSLTPDHHGRKLVFLESLA